MKAIGVTEFGGPEVLRVLDLPVPQAGPGDIRIRVHAATVNPVDAMVREGMAFVDDAQPPYVPGMEAAAGAVRDGGRVSAFLGQHGTGERGILTQAVFVPAYAREHAKLDRLRQLAEHGRITPRVAQTLPVEQAAEAHRLAASGVRGRLVLTF
jgi:NADPH:quinone reductase-like Zn-dependent oxidoreductase